MHDRSMNAVDSYCSTVSANRLSNSVGMLLFACLTVPSIYRRSYSNRSKDAVSKEARRMQKGKTT